MKLISVKNKKGLKIFLWGLFVAFVVVLGSAGAFIIKLDKEMLLKMQQKQMIQPTIFYSRVLTWKVGELFPLDDIKKNLDQQLRSRTPDQKLFPGDFVLVGGIANCKNWISPDANQTQSDFMESDHCLRLYWEKGPHRLFKEPLMETLWLGDDLKIKGIFRGEESTPSDTFIMMPQVVAQYLGEEPILREELALREIPVACLNAIMAIEDAKFLEHKGVSWVGILRAGVVNLLRGKKAQGGSTLTQQLVKNYFLTPEKTLKRKALEFIMALLMENRFDKDLILETYLNIIYMGQQGPYQVRGYGSAARHYFQKSASDLSLAQCSLLAAIVNSPGQYNPFLNPEKAKMRRSLVLQKMEEQKFITKQELSMAEAEPLPNNENPKLYITLPYFLQAALFQAKKVGLNEIEGHRLFTTLDLRYQEAAQGAIVNSLKQIESENSAVKKVKARKKIDLEGALVSVDIETGGVRALVGGRSFNKTQFNRILLSKRQVGSTFKPFVYLTALSASHSKDEASDNNSWFDFSKRQTLSPDDMISDEPFTYRYEKQKWAPENYDHKNHGMVPLYFALKESLNVATAKLALDVGLDPIIDMVRALGVTSDLKPMPSLSLGAFELNPMELLQAYMTVARFGNFIDYTFLDYIESTDGQILWDSARRESVTKVSSIATQVLIGMLKQTTLTGTAKRIHQIGFNKIVAGKTGTTNDYRDSWFVGFTPDLLTIVWTGYDDNTSSGLTGASGSLPAWIEYMQEATKYQAVRDFSWTDEVEQKAIPAFQNPLSPPSSTESTSSETLDLIFKK